MLYEFNADNILEMAETIEKNGADFYRDAALKVHDKNAKQALLDLAREEDEHFRIFSGIRNTLSEQQKRNPGFSVPTDVSGYLHALANTKIFFEKEILSPDDLSDTDSSALLKSIYLSALRAEKDSIVFYVGLKEMVPEAFGRSKVDEIIQEEMRHLTQLSQELAAV